MVAVCRRQWFWQCLRQPYGTLRLYESKLEQCVPGSAFGAPWCLHCCKTDKRKFDGNFARCLEVLTGLSLAFQTGVRACSPGSLDEDAVKFRKIEMSCDVPCDRCGTDFQLSQVPISF